MIKINLLPQKRKRPGRTPVARTASSGQRDLLIGVGAIFAAAAIVFFSVHRPLMNKRASFETKNEELSSDNAAKRAALKDYQNLKQIVAASEERSSAIDKLMKAKSVPANLLHELGEILTPGRLPTMSAEMAKKISDGPQGDPNKRFALDWDPKHVWITSFTEKEGVFTLKGGAQSDPDVTQLAKRLQASVYFMDVTPQGGQRVMAKESTITYYEFTITGKVVY
jgi:type IV pilus assembly protein PilN